MEIKKMTQENIVELVDSMEKMLAKIREEHTSEHYDVPPWANTPQFLHLPMPRLELPHEISGGIMRRMGVTIHRPTDLIPLIISIDSPGGKVGFSDLHEAIENAKKALREQVRSNLLITLTKKRARWRIKKIRKNGYSKR